MLTPQERYFPRERVIRETKITCLVFLSLLCLVAVFVLAMQL